MKAFRSNLSQGRTNILKISNKQGIMVCNREEINRRWRNDIMKIAGKN